MHPSHPAPKSVAPSAAAFECHSVPRSLTDHIRAVIMAGKSSTTPHSKRKPPTPKTTPAPKPRSQHKLPPSRDLSHPDEKSQRAGSKYRKFAYPERRSPAKSENALQASSSSHPTASNKHYVFVYGTLKKGFANSHLLDRATLIGDFRTVTRYPLVVGGKYNSPYLLDMPAKGARVKGEVYVVDDATLADLDHLENVGVNYSRHVIKVSSCADRSFAADAFVYFKTNGLEELSKKEFLEDYQCRLYVPRHKRNEKASERESVPVKAHR